MLKELSSYGAASAKVRALWGRRLRSEDYKRMAAMRTVSELALFLQSTPRWGPALAGLDMRSIDRHTLESRLRLRTLEEGLSFYPYLNEKDRNLVSFPVLDVELMQIMRYLRFAGVGRSHEYSYAPPSFLRTRSKINYGALSVATTYEQLLDAVSGTAFAPVLARLKPDAGGFPAFTVVETALRAHYLRSMYSMVKKRRTDGTRDALLETIAMRGEMFNISVILRVKRFYPHLEGQLLGFLIPIHAHLRPAFIKQLCDAPSAEDAMELLRRSFYKRYLTPDDVTADSLSDRVRYDFSRKRLYEPVPTVLTPLSYLYLAEIELQNVIHITECVRYNVSPEEALQYVFP